jgi:hypothetical protein
MSNHRSVLSGLRVGLGTSVQVALGVLLLWLVPALSFGYPLVLLPLLITGPLASRKVPLQRGLLTVAALRVNRRS